jgi:hypothetical protein
MSALTADVYHLSVPSWQRFLLVGFMVVYSLFGLLLFAATSDRSDLV